MRNPLSLTAAILLCAALLFLPAALAQNETTQTGPRKRALPTRRGDEDLSRVFRSYERLSLDTAEADARVRQTGRLVINTGRRTFDLELEPHDMRAANYRAEETVAPGVTRRVEMGAVRTYRGRALGSDGVEARFTIDEESLEGLILTPDDFYYIEPARHYLPSAARTEFLLYKGSDVIETEPASCVVAPLHEKVGDAADQLGGESPAASAAVTGGEPQPLALARPLEVELATEADFEFVRGAGSSENADAEILSIMNQVEGIYQRDIGLSFKITSQHTWATSSDPYTATDAVAALNELTNYWNKNFTTVPRDVVHMWTGKNITYNGGTGIAGVAWGGGSSGGVVCKNGGTSSYGLSERWTIAPQKFILPAHELGHNFDGVHTDGVAGCDNTVMRSFASDSSVLTFCAASITRITAYISANSSCLSPAPVCTFTISPTSASFTSAGGSDTFSVSASDAGCAWTATTAATWIHITAGASGNGSGRVSYTVDANTLTSTRSATIAAAGQTYTVTQSGAPACSFTLTPTSATAAAAGDTGSVTVTAAAGCDWTAASNDTWLHVTAGASGSGNGTVSYSVDANTATTSRQGSLTIAGKTFTVTQAGSACTFTISPTSASFSSAASADRISVTTTAGCAWTAKSNVTWLTITAGASGTGSGTVSYSVAANTATTSRTGTITVAGKTFTVTQDGLACTFTISPTSATYANGGGSGRITVTTSAGCAWTARSNVAWITVTAGASGNGSGTVSYTVAANTASTSRTGTITVAGKTFTVTQSGVTCTFTLNTTSASVPAAGAAGTITVTGPAACTWTAVSNSAFIHITAGGSGSGNGTATFKVDANTATTSRSGTITIAGKTFTVNQAGSPPSLASLVVNPATVIGGCQTATGTVTLSAAAPSGGVVVSLSDNIAATTVPASVTVAAGTTTKNFTITTAAVSVNQGGTVTASANGVSRTDTLAVRAIGVSSVSVSPNPIIGGNTATGTVTLECPAAPGNITVTLSDNIASTTLPASVVVAAGTSTKTFSITTTAVGNNQVGTLTATAGGISKSVSVTVRRIGLASLTLNPTTVTSGESSTGTVTLERAAGPSSITVTLTSSNTAIATVPSSISIPAGTTSKTFTVTTKQMASGTVTITATANGTTKSATLTVNTGGGE